MKEERIIVLNCRRYRLSGVLHHPRTPKPHGAAILCHGMDSDKNSEKLVFLARALAAAGCWRCASILLTSASRAASFEDITCSGEMDDLRAAYALVQNHRPGKIALLGSSMGGTVAVLFAATQPAIAALVTVAAPLHPEHFPRRMLTEAQLRDWRERGFTTYNGKRLNVSLLEDLERLDPPQAARAVACPMLVLHGDADAVVPVEEAYELHGCLAGQKRLSILPGGDHRLSDPALMRRALEESLDWLTDPCPLRNFHAKFLRSIELFAVAAASDRRLRPRPEHRPGRGRRVRRPALRAHRSAQRPKPSP